MGEAKNAGPHVFARSNGRSRRDEALKTASRGGACFRVRGNKVDGKLERRLSEVPRASRLTGTCTARLRTDAFATKVRHTIGVVKVVSQSFPQSRSVLPGHELSVCGLPQLMRPGKPPAQVRSSWGGDGADRRCDVKMNRRNGPESAAKSLAPRGNARGSGRRDRC